MTSTASPTPDTSTPSSTQLSSPTQEKISENPETSSEHVSELPPPESSSIEEVTISSSPTPSPEPSTSELFGNPLTESSEVPEPDTTPTTSLFSEIESLTVEESQTSLDSIPPPPPTESSSDAYRPLPASTESEPEESTVQPTSDYPDESTLSPSPNPEPTTSSIDAATQTTSTEEPSVPESLTYVPSPSAYETSSSPVQGPIESEFPPLLPVLEISTSSTETSSPVIISPSSSDEQSTFSEPPVVTSSSPVSTEPETTALPESSWSEPIASEPLTSLTPVVPETTTSSEWPLEESSTILLATPAIVTTSSVESLPEVVPTLSPEQSTFEEVTLVVSESSSAAQAYLTTTPSSSPVPVSSLTSEESPIATQPLEVTEALTVWSLAPSEESSFVPVASSPVSQSPVSQSPVSQSPTFQTESSQVVPTTASAPSSGVVQQSAVPEPSTESAISAVEPTPAPSSPAETEPAATEEPAPSSTKNWLPTQIVAESTSTSGESIAAATTAATKTSGLPKAITPAQTASPGKEYSLIYIGFKESLNYPFVVENSLSSAQIFEYLPRVLQFPFGDKKEYKDTIVSSLVPYHADGIEYAITVAEVYFPANAVDALSQLVLDDNSKLYRNPDDTEAKLASLIDKRIPIVGLNTGDGSSLSSSDLNNGSYDSSNNPVKNKGTIAGVATGAALGSIIYMSLMVLLFKKYKKKRALQLPPSDNESSLDWSSQEDSGVPSNSNGTNSTRPEISEPVNAFNSLGWSTN